MSLESVKETRRAAAVHHDSEKFHGRARLARSQLAKSLARFVQRACTQTVNSVATVRFTKRNKCMPFA